MSVTKVSRAGPGNRAGRVPWRDIVDLARLAPSVHNSQPWRWTLQGRTLHLHGDPTRRLVHTDPAGRTLTISCGAALHHAQVAAAALGWRLAVDRMPDDDDWHLAALTARPVRATPHEESLLDALRSRRTDRRPLTTWPVLPEVLSRVSSEAAGWGAVVLPVVDQPRKWRIEDLMRRADELQRSDPRNAEELADWRRQGARPDSVDGVPPANLDSGSRSRLGWVPSRFDPTGAQDHVGTGHELVVLFTRREDPESWLLAGETLSALWLELTRRRMALLPLSQVTEVPETRAALARTVVDPALVPQMVPQMVLRVGWPPTGRPPVAPTPRRPLSEVYVESGVRGRR